MPAKPPKRAATYGTAAGRRGLCVAGVGNAVFQVDGPTTARGRSRRRCGSGPPARCYPRAIPSAPPPLDICRQSPRTNTGACAPTARANLGSQGHHVARRWHYGSGPLAPGLPRALADIILGQPSGIPGREPCGLQVPPHHERNSRNQERDRERVQGFHLPHPLLLSQPPPSPPSWG